MLLLSKQRTFSLIFNLLAPNDALEAAGLEGRWQGERSLSGRDELLTTLMTPTSVFEVPLKLKVYKDVSALDCARTVIQNCFA